MNRFENFTRPLTWFMAMLLTAFVAGCGSDGGASAVASSAKAITAYSLAGVIGTIDEPAKTIAVTVPFGTNLTALAAAYTTTGASLKVGTTVQGNGTTANDFTGPVDYTVVAADGTTATYTVTVAVAIDTSKAITAYSLAGTPGIINEPAKTIAVTVPYGTNVTALAAAYTTTGTGVKVGVVVQSSGITMNDFTGQVAYTVTAADTSTAAYTVTVVVAHNFAKAVTAYSFVGYPGVTGTIDETAKSISLTMPAGTDKTTLIALFTSTGASVNVGGAAQTSGATANNFTNPVRYTVTAANGTTAIYTVTVAVAIASDKAITAYSFVGFPSVAGTIDETAKTIALTLPYGTNKTALVATFLTTGTVVKIGSAVQTSTATANDFTLPKDYIVTAADGTTATYTVTVTVALNFANAITAYSFVGFPAIANAGTIVEATTPRTIAVTVPNGTDVTSLVAIFTTTGANVKVGAAVQTSTATANNFVGAVTYTVTAADGTPATYTVTVAAAGPDLGLAAPFAVAAKAGIVNVGATTINGNVLLQPNTTCNNAALTGVGDFIGCGGTAPVLGGTSKVISSLYDPLANRAAIQSSLETAFLSITPLAGPPAVGSLGGGTTLAAAAIGGVRGGALVAGTNYFTPGIYKSASTIDVSGDVTLDAGGNANALFIFQAGSALNVAAGGVSPSNTRILLIGSAKASNVWWQVGSTATIGTYSEFQGSVLAAVNITMETGATACGRLLAGAWAGSGGAGVATFGDNIVSVPGQTFVPPAGYSAVCQ